MKKSYIFLLFAFLFCNALVAQLQETKWSVAAYGGISNYKGDLSTNNFYDPNDQILNLFDNTDFLSYGLSIGKRINDGWSMRLMASRNTFVANDRKVDWNNEPDLDYDQYNRSLNVRSEINDISLLGVWSLANGHILDEKVFLSPYFVIGGGYARYKNYGDLFTGPNNSQRYYYWTDNTIRDMVQDETNTGNIIMQDGDFETELSPLNTEGVDYKTRFFHATGGFGLKFRLFSRMSLNIESLFRFTNTDYVDDVRSTYLNNYDSDLQAYAANPGRIEGRNRGNQDSKNDRLHLTTISLHYHFGKETELFVAPAILIGDLYDTDKKQGINELPTTADTTYQPLTFIPVIDLDNIEMDGTLKDVENLDIPDFSMMDTTTMDTTMVDYEIVDEDIDYIEDLKLEPYDAEAGLDVDDFPMGIDTFYRVVTPMDSIYYTDELSAGAIMAEEVDTLTRVGNELFVDVNKEWEPVDGEDWESYNQFLLEHQLSDSTSLLNEESKPVFEKAEGTQRVDLSTTEDTLTEAELIAIANPVVEQPPLTIDNTIVDTAEQLSIENAPMPTKVMISENPKVDSLYQQINALSLTIAELREEQGNQQANTEAIVNQRMQSVQAELDSIRLNQKRMTNELSDQWRADFQLAMTSIEKQIQDSNRAPTTTTAPPAQTTNAEVEGMRREMESMRNYLMQNQNNNQGNKELDEYKRQLWLYEIQSRNLNQNQAERQKLETEIRELKKTVADQQNRQTVIPPSASVTPQIVTVPSSANREEVATLKTQVATMNTNMEEMKALLKAQNNKNTQESSAELLALKAEIAALSASVKSSAAPSSTASSQDAETIRRLNEELAAMRKEISNLSNKPAPAPTTPTVITNTVAPAATTAREAIAGREKQLVFFQLGASKLDAPSMQIIQSVSQLMNKYPSLYAELEGFTDPSGNADSNMVLSGKRATSVQRFLTQYGIDASRLIVIPRGEDPASNATYGRRVAIRLNVR